MDDESNSYDNLTGIQSNENRGSKADAHFGSTQNPSYIQTLKGFPPVGAAASSRYDSINLTSKQSMADPDKSGTLGTAGLNLTTSV